MRLAKADESSLSDYELSGGGIAIHWEKLNENLLVLVGFYNLFKFSTNTTETTTKETANTSNNAEDPFAGTTWEADTGNMGIVITTIKFSNNKTVDYYMTTSGTKTSLYSGPYEVTKNYLDVEGQYGASVGSQTFVIPNKDATSVSWGGKTFIKK